MIESYNFGKVVIAGKAYTKDVIIYPDRIDSTWWRKEGHSLCIEDIQDLLEKPPETLIIGTGAYGRMKVLPATEEELKSRGIKVVIQETAEACKTYNRLSSSQRVVAALHLTC